MDFVGELKMAIWELVPPFVLRFRHDLVIKTGLVVRIRYVGHFIQAESLPVLHRCKKPDLGIEEGASSVASQKDFSVVVSCHPYGLDSDIPRGNLF